VDHYWHLSHYLDFETDNLDDEGPKAMFGYAHVSGVSLGYV